MAGRPPLRIGEHGNISRRYLGDVVWQAFCRFRDGDGVVKKVQRLGPADEFDKRGKLAENALIEALVEHRTPSAGQISLDTSIWFGWPRMGDPPHRRCRPSRLTIAVFVSDVPP
jgi:hypothetical protein